MKTREVYENIRRRGKNRLSLRLRLTLLVSAELVVCVLLAVGVYYIVVDWIPLNQTLLLILISYVLKPGVSTIIFALCLTG